MKKYKIEEIEESLPKLNEKNFKKMLKKYIRMENVIVSQINENSKNINTNEDYLYDVLHVDKHIISDLELLKEKK